MDDLDRERMEDDLRAALSEAVMWLGPEAVQAIVSDELAGVVVIHPDGRVEST